MWSVAPESIIQEGDDKVLRALAGIPVLAKLEEVEVEETVVEGESSQAIKCLRVCNSSWERVLASEEGLTAISDTCAWGRAVLPRPRPRVGRPFSFQQCSRSCLSFPQ
ncbi:hypothetical protein CsSME_00042203 [Camellia sinensis var. sinensis]